MALKRDCRRGTCSCNCCEVSKHRGRCALAEGRAAFSVASRDPAQALAASEFPILSAETAHPCDCVQMVLGKLGWFGAVYGHQLMSIRPALLTALVASLEVEPP